MQILILLTDVVEKLILLTLLGLSIWSVSIILDRRRVFRTQSGDSLESAQKLIQEKNWEALRSWAAKTNNVVAGALVQALQAPLESEKIDRAVASYWKMEKRSLEKGLAVLATLGANAPFIGLFGTVLGIIRAFAYLGSQTGSASVMSGVSQALYATAAGLFVAIPAVIAFNIFSKNLKDLQTQIESLKDLYISRLDSKKSGG